MVLSAQIVPGTFTFALNYLVDHELDHKPLDARFKNDEVGANAWRPLHQGGSLKVAIVARTHQNKGNRMHFKDIRVALVAVCMSGLMAPVPSYADGVICDGNPLCLLAISPLIAGVMLFAPNSPIDTAIAAIERGDSEKLRSILKSHPELIRGQANNLIRAATFYDRLNELKILLDAGVSPSDKFSDGLARARSVAVLELLLSRGASASEFNLGLFPFQYPKDDNNDVARLNIMLAHRGLSNPDSEEELALLSKAAQFHRGEVMGVLLQRGLNPNGSRKYPDYPTLFELAKSCERRENGAACEAEILPIARVLFEKGANVNIVDVYFDQSSACRTPLELARENGLSSFVALLQSAGATDNPPEKIACQHDVQERSPNKG